MKIIKNIIITVLSIFFLLLLTYNVYNFIAINVLNQDLATVNGYAVLEVVSGSMEPTIDIGDIVVIDTKEKDYKKGDIVTFYDTEGSFVTHRIVSIEGDQMVTRGDNNNVEDNPTNTSEIVGKYKFKISRGGKLLAAFKSPFTMIMILIIGILVCVFISTDKNGNPILEEEEKEYLEFQKYLEQKQEYEKIQKYINKKKKKNSKKNIKSHEKMKSSKSIDRKEE